MMTIERARAIVLERHGVHGRPADWVIDAYNAGDWDGEIAVQVALALIAKADKLADALRAQIDLRMDDYPGVHVSKKAGMLLSIAALALAEYEGNGE